MKTVRTSLNLPPWDVIFPGTVVGKLLLVENIDSIKEDQLKEPRVAILNSAHGDEDIPAQMKG